MLIPPSLPKEIVKEDNGFQTSVSLHKDQRYVQPTSQLLKQSQVIRLANYLF
jgi:hypothetical protein